MKRLSEPKREEITKNDPDEYLVSLSNEYYSEAEEARRPHKAKWDEIWNAYNNIFDFSKKASWQSKHIVSKIPTAIRQAASLIKRALLRSSKLYTVTTDNDGFKKYIYGIEQNMKYWLDKARFIETLVEALIAAMTSSLLILKIFWIEEETYDDMFNDRNVNEPTVVLPEAGASKGMVSKISSILSGVFAPAVEKTKRKKGRLVISGVRQDDFLLDPRGRGLYCIHTVRKDLADIKDRAKKYGYDAVVLAKIEEDFAGEEKSYQEQIKQGNNTASKPAKRKEIQLDEYWGNIIDEDGKMSKRNVTWTIANKKYVIRKPTKNPNIHGKAPFVVAPLVVKPFSVYHKPFMDDSLPMAYALNDIFNLIYDGNSFAMANAYELDLDIVYDAQQFVNGIYPGMVMKKRANGQLEAQMVRPVALGQMPAQSLRLYQEASREYENASAISEFISAKPSSRGRATATETSIKSQEGMEFINDIAVDLEGKVMTPLFEMVFLTLFQYQKDFSNIENNSNIDQSQVLDFKYAAATYDDEKKKEFIEIYKFKVNGISDVLRRQGELNNIIQVAQVLAQFPQAAKFFKVRALVEKGAIAVDWDVNEVLYTDEEIAQQEQQAQAAQAQMEQKQMEMMAMQEGIKAKAKLASIPPEPPAAPEGQ